MKQSNIIIKNLFIYIFLFLIKLQIQAAAPISFAEKSYVYQAGEHCLSVVSSLNQKGKVYFLCIEEKNIPATMSVSQILAANQYIDFWDANIEKNKRLDQLQPGTVYHIYLLGVNDAGETSQIVELKDSTFVKTKGLLPSPLALDAFNISNTSFVAYWEGNRFSNAYRVDVYTKDSLNRPISISESPFKTKENTLQISGLDSNTYYYYTVTSLATDDTSWISNEISLKTTNCNTLITSLAELRTQVIDSTIYCFTEEAIVTMKADDFEGKTFHYIQDHTGAIILANDHQNPNYTIEYEEGDKLQHINGRLKNINGALVFYPVRNSFIISKENFIEPTIKTINELEHTTMDAQLIQLNHVSFNEKGNTFALNQQYTITDATGQITMNTCYNLDYIGEKLPSKANMIGVLMFQNGEYQFILRSLNDIDILEPLAFLNTNKSTINFSQPVRVSQSSTITSFFVTYCAPKKDELCIQAPEGFKVSYSMLESTFRSDIKTNVWDSGVKTVYLKFVPTQAQSYQDMIQLSLTKNKKDKQIPVAGSTPVKPAEENVPLIDVFANNHQIQIQSNASLKQIQVFTILGQVIYVGRNQPVYIQNSGTYIVRIFTEKNVIVKKVIVL